MQEAINYNMYMTLEEAGQEKGYMVQYRSDLHQGVLLDRTHKIILVGNVGAETLHRVLRFISS